MDVSFVIPVFNEENSIEELHDKITTQMNPLTENYDIIFVDDGSSDNSFEILNNISIKDQHVKIIKLRKNFGKSIALDEGFKFAQGDIIFTMDAVRVCVVDREIVIVGNVKNLIHYSLGH